jgi:D-galactose 1-dehydrogenase
VPHASDLEAFLAGGVPFDAAAICTPPQVRCALAARAMAAGKHVLLEKPPGVTSVEALALVPQAAQAGVTLFAAWHSRYAAGVAPARDWLRQQRPLAGRIEWKEDFRVWHPGQDWIWRAGGMGVFDPGINALSILSALHPGPWSVERARLETPSNAETPVRAELDLRSADGLAVNAVFDFLHEGPPLWDLALSTDAGELKLSAGGAKLSIAGTPVAEHPDREYAGVYADWAELIAAGRSDVDVAPLELVEAAQRLGETVTAPPVEI